jgi:hypothetical protein
MNPHFLFSEHKRAQVNAFAVFIDVVVVTETEVKLGAVTGGSGIGVRESLSTYDGCQGRRIDGAGTRDSADGGWHMSDD